MNVIQLIEAHVAARNHWLVCDDYGQGTAAIKAADCGGYTGKQLDLIG